MDRIYLEKLDINYFKACIAELIEYYETEEINPEEYLKKMEELSVQITGLRDVFFIFAIDDVLELKKPVLIKIEELKNQNPPLDRQKWHKENHDIIVDKGSEDWKLAEEYKEQHPMFSNPKILIVEVWRDVNNFLCVRYESEFGRSLDWFHYTFENEELGWW